MKRSLLFVWICAAAFASNAQNIPLFAGEYVPFHQFMAQHKPLDNVPSMRNANQLKDFLGAFEIASLHYTYVSQPSDSGWNIVDSSTFTYKDSLPFPVADTMLAYNATNQSWAYDSEFSISSYYLPSQPVTDQDSFQGSKTWMAYNGGSGTWSNTYNYNYGYDANQRLISFASQTWNSGSSSWTTVDSISTIYNSSGLDSIRSVFTFNSGVVQNDTQYTYFYNDNIYDANNRDSIIIISVNGVQYQRYLYQYTPLSYLFTGIDIDSFNGSGWSLYGVYTYTRNNNQETYLLQLLVGGQYVNTYEENFMLDYRNNVLSFENDNFNGNTPVPVVQYTYGYDIDNDLTFEQDAYWNTGAGSYMATDQYYYYYEWMPVLGIHNVKSNLSAEIFPNPSSGPANIQMTADVSSPLLISVFDAAGHKVNEISTSVVAGNNTLPLQLNALAAGNYLINLRAVNSGKSTTLNWVKQ